MSRLVFCFCLIIASATLGKTQNVRIKEDPLIAQMMSKFVEANKAQQTIEGWRIEILATTNRQEMESAMQTFKYRYPELSVDWFHDSPYFKLRVGAFATKIEATRMLHILKKDYPGAYRILDNKMKPEELLN